MGTHNTHGVKGRLDLFYDFSESSSGHVDTTTSHFLRTADEEKSVELVLQWDHNDMYRNGNSSASEGVYSISPDALIDLIKAHGKRVK